MQFSYVLFSSGQYCRMVKKNIARTSEAMGNGKSLNCVKNPTGRNGNFPEKLGERRVEKKTRAAV